MPHRTSYDHGTPSWIDLTTVDTDGAKQFYSELFGWTWDDQSAPGGSVYSMASKDGQLVAGLGKTSPEMAEAGVPPMWNTYFSVDDCDDAAKKVAEAGGSLMFEPFDIPGAGRMAFFVDDQGSAAGLWQADGHIGCGLVNAPGAYTWAELNAKDTGAAKAFYGAALGLGSAEMDIGDFTYTMFNVGDETVGGTLKPPMEQIPNHWHVYLGTEDAKTTADKAAELGGKVVMGPMDTPQGPMATIKDAQGATFSAIQLNQWPS